MLDTGWPSLKLDQRNRLALPPPVREGADQVAGASEWAVGVLPGIANRCIWLLTPQQFSRFCSRLEDWCGDDEKGRLVKTLTRAGFTRVATDNQGRMSIPQALLDEAGIQERVTLVGQSDRVEVWSTEAFEALQSSKAAEVGRELESIFKEETRARRDRSNALGPASGRTGEGMGPSG